MSSNLETAKVIFIKYGGNHFFMEREGEYILYKSFNISKEQEIDWIREHHKEIIRRIKAENSVKTLVTKLSEISNSIILFKDIDSFQSILDIVKEKSRVVDSFSRLRMAEEIYNIIDALSKNKVKKENVLPYAKKLVLDILNSIIENPIIVDEDYHKMGYLKDILNDDNIISRAKRLIQIIK